ncbi:MAG: Hsp20/alpha crystallin family protein [Anaerolineae bacterium]|nr:Hsp20/alpha crystallin family protein [Anaerolineae bacterium]
MSTEEKKERERGEGISIDPSAALRQGSGQGLGQALGLGEMFKGLGDLIKLATDLADKVDLSELDEEKLAELRRASQTRVGGIPRGVYGVSVRRGIGGIPRVQPFGNIRRTERGPVVDEVQEPLVDVFDEDDMLLAIAELPGVEEKDIQVGVHDGLLKLSTTTKGRRYAKELQLPCPVEESTMESTYKNGVLEIRLRKTSNAEGM